MQPSRIPLVDLFAGAGGLSLGARKAGADNRLLVDTDAVACETLRMNSKRHGGVVLERDVAHLTGEELRSLGGLGKHDELVVVGGPPCQPFSKASYWTENGAEARYRKARANGKNLPRPPAPTTVKPDGRRSLVEEFLRLVIESKADGFLLENVPSILHPRNRPIVEQFVRQAEASGYKVAVIEANAAEYGVAQRRRRVFVLGAKRRRPLSPTPTHSKDESAQGRLKSVVTAGSALEPYAGAEFFEPEEVVSGKWAEHLRTVPPGWNYKAHTAWGGHPQPTFVTETRFWHFLLKLSPDLPAWTIPATPGPWTGPFHWESRRLRIPELAALQGFVKGYRFAGNRRERVRQIGNAVPAPLAQKVVHQVLKAVEDKTR